MIYIDARELARLTADAAAGGRKSLPGRRCSGKDLSGIKAGQYPPR
jgi:hypothetical protein